jgi:ubiquinone/menaquinone biosynthesis C-methylase UbiE
MNHYVHGYSEREAERLHDQAHSVRELLHYDTTYPAGSKVLEAGCGVGAQTVTLARSSPDTQFVSIDLSVDSLEKARALLEGEMLSNVQFHRADIFDLPFEEEAFDHVFVCYVLEHLQHPVAALAALRRVLKKEGSITVIEGDHGSCYFHPETDEAICAWNCLIRVQARLGGNSLIGRQVFPLLKKAGFRDVHVSPRMVYIDQSMPELMDGFVKKTIIPMVEGVKEQALEMQMMNDTSWNKGNRDLQKVAERGNGTFCYTFFKAIGIK